MVFATVCECPLHKLTTRRTLAKFKQYIALQKPDIIYLLMNTSIAPAAEVRSHHSRLVNG